MGSSTAVRAESRIPKVEVPAPPPVPEGLPSPRAEEDGTFLPAPLDIVISERARFFELDYPKSCQASVDLQWQLGAEREAQLEAAILEQEPLLPSWAWVVIGGAAGALATTLLFVGTQ